MILSNVSKGFVFLLGLFFLGILVNGIFKLSPATIIDLINDPAFLFSVGFTLKTSIIASLFALLFGVPAGFFLARNKTSFSHILDLLFDIPIVLPPLVVGVLLLSFFNLPLVEKLYSFIFTTSGAAIAQFFIAVPFTIKASKSAFELISPIYERIAMTLGARPIKSFFDTTFKMALPGILSGFVLTWLRCVGEFGATLMVGGGIPGKTENIPVHVYLNIVSGDFEKGLGAGMIAVFLAFFCIVLVNLFVTRRIRQTKHF